MPEDINLLSRSSGRITKAHLLEESEIDFEQQRTQWQPWLNCYRNLGDQADFDWDWKLLLSEEKKLNGNVQCFAIEKSGLYQGMIILGKTSPANIRLADGERGELLYISYLATAPWNRLDFRTRRKAAPPPRLSGVGIFLVLYSIQISQVRGFGGRVGLHALQGAVDFYVKQCHFTFLGGEVFDPDLGYPWLELPEVSANHLMGRASTLTGKEES